MGLSDESARALRSWYAFKIRSVLNKPSHISHVPTKDLFELYSIEDPITKLEKLQANRLRNLEAQSRTNPNITNSQQAQQQSRDILEVLRQHKHTPHLDALAASPDTPCPHCDSSFASQHGLRLHIAKKHASLVQRYVPSSFDRLRHAKDGVPTCRACETSFKHWLGLMSHLLSGACPEPSKLAAIDADSQAEPLAEPLARLKQTIGNSARFQLPVVAKSVDSQALTSQCLQCGFWTPDYTKLKSHLRKVHTAKWSALSAVVEKTCGDFAAHTIKGLSCPFCKLKVYNRNKHCFQCPVMFQVVFEWHAGQPFTSHTNNLNTDPTQLTLQQVMNASHPPSSTPRQDTPASNQRVLLNSSNSCYLNSVLTALFHSAQDLPDTGLEAVFAEMRLGEGAATRPLNMHTSFALRSRTVGWRFDGRQHDAAEFYSALALSGGLQPVPWQARVDGNADRVEHGYTPLPLPVDQSSSLQSRLDAWAGRGLQYALLEAPRLLPVVLRRWLEAQKNQAPITGLRDPLQVPVWQEGQQRCMVSYRLRAGVFHIGDSVSAGHYRAFWPLQPRGMAVSDDFVRPSVAGASDSTRISRGSYLCFLERAE